MEGCHPPRGLNFNGNMADNWRRFKQLFEIYLIASGNEAKSSEVKVAILLNAAGEEAVEVFNTFNLSAEDRKDFDKVVNHFEKFTTPKRNVVVERFIFNQRCQEEGETFDVFVMDLKKLVKSCEFGDQSDSVVRDRIVLGVGDASLQERMLRESDLSLERAIDLGKTAELSKIRAQTVQGQNVDFVGRRSGAQKPLSSREANWSNKDGTVNKSCQNGEKARMFSSCWKCNRKHVKGKCPAYGKRCHSCNNLNHFSVVCRYKDVKDVVVDESEDNGDYYVNSINVHHIVKCIESASTLKEWNKTLIIEGQPVTLKLDTGAEVNVLPLSIFNLFKSQSKMRKCNVVLKAFGGATIKPVGSISLNCSVDNLNCVIDFIIVANPQVRPLLGINECVKLDLIHFVNDIEIPNKNKLDQYMNMAFSSKDEFIQNNVELFEGVGKFKGTCKINIKNDATPVVRPPRRVPLTVKPKLELKLKELEAQGIIAKVDQPKEWVSNIVIIEKANGTIRICLDPQDLKKVIKREHVLIPTIEEFLPKLTNKSVYSVLDLKDGFFQIPLDVKSSELCTFSTPFGCYKFLRLPMGISCAPEIFQKRNQENFGDIQGVLIYFDDLLIAANSIKEHGEILAKVVRRAKSLNIKFNKNKVQFRVPEVKYLGHVFNVAGMRPDPERVKAVVELKEPKNKLELQRVLGMLNYLRRFVPHFSTKTAALRELLKQKVEWQWLGLHSQAFKELKNLICNAPVLGIFDSNKPITLQADSSKDGLGCCLLQNGQPIAFSSRSLTDSEKNYAQIEKEFLSILFAVNKFHYYIYGREVEVLTDHKPLVSIMNKNIVNVLSNRLQRIKIKLLKYQLNLKYLPGKFMHIADLLSRSFNEKEIQLDDEDMIETVHTLTKQLQMSEIKKREFKEATLKDQGLKKVQQYWETGWPNSIDKVPKEARSYFRFRHELSVEQDLVFLNSRVVVPVSLRKSMLLLLHEAHCGVEKSKARARQVIFWPNINVILKK
ncbi:Transposon Ty3-G Gag-Pol polyprotein [Araneus ventricosus]|uniref:RNA-directed DNA polymerase n=1 Tax=Araneus ventricosus TaxID=182803 RepID=A0A4Y2X0A0_ARAVE|nr:Transposon Ty3-G Gag-Pol polyprotein [Araneus ventricosus]